VIIGQYRTVIQKSDMMDEERKAAALKVVTRASLVAITIGVIVVICVAVPLGILSRGLNDRVVSGIEGGSKLVACFCILQLSLKMPYWMRVYKKVSIFPCKKYDPDEGKKDIDSLTLKEIRFNIIWNIWRETAECGVFLIPFFLGKFLSLVCRSLTERAPYPVRCSSYHTFEQALAQGPFQYRQLSALPYQPFWGRSYTWPTIV